MGVQCLCGDFLAIITGRIREGERNQKVKVEDQETTDHERERKPM